MSDTETYRFGAFLLDVPGSELRVQAGRGGGWTTVPLRPQAFHVLVHLIRNRNRAVKKEELFGQIPKNLYKDKAGYDANVVDQALRDLRRQLHEDPETPVYIATPTRGALRFICVLDDPQETEARRIADGNQEDTPSGSQSFNDVAHLSQVATVDSAMGDHRAYPIRVYVNPIGEPFSGMRESFFNTLLERFFRWYGLLVELCDEVPDPFEALTQNKLDLIFPCLSVHSSTMVRFWATPIRLSLGAVILSKDQSQRIWIQRALSGQMRRTHQRMLPIVVKGEVGAIHCINNLGFLESDIVCEYQPSPVRLAHRLRQLAGDATAVPVVIVAEHTCFKVLRELGKDGSAVLPLMGRNTRARRRELPQYFVGFACSRRNPELAAMIRQAFQLFLTSDLEGVASTFAIACDDLLRLSADAADYYLEPATSFDLDCALRYRLAGDWALYTVGLDRQSIAGYPNSDLPWRPVLERARELVQEDLAMDVKTITDQIKLCTRYKPDDVPFSHNEFQELCAAFDLEEPMLTFAQRKYVFEDRGMVLATIQNALLKRPVPALNSEIHPVNRPTPELLSVMTGFLGEISRMYKRELGENNEASTQVDYELLRPLKIDSSRLPANFSTVLLASNGKPVRHYIGSLWLRTYENTRAPSTERELEFCHLFVLEAFRNLKVGRELLRWAHSEAKCQGCAALVFEALPQCLEGMLYLRKLGFTAHPEREPSVPGRLVMRLLTTQPLPDFKNEL
jgi:DNA-binding winged helix-turn-helix (wHTH) protein/GNAT superfamily N-acetyltransferase